MHGPVGKVESPYIPKTHVQYAWDSTSLEWLKRCPRLYQYSMIEGWVPNEESADLRFGIEYHKGIEEYKRARIEGESEQTATQRALRNLLERTTDWESDHKYKNRRFLVRTVLWYIFHFQDDAATTLMLPNNRPALELSFRFELDYGPKTWRPGQIKYKYVICGHLDEVVEFQSDQFVMDRKTTIRTPGSYYFDQFEPNNQMTLYTIASQIVVGSPIKGVIIDAAQIAIDFSRFTRGFTFRTQDQIEEWLLDLRFWLEKAEDYAIAGYWPLNDTACDKYGGCRFRKVCSRSPQVREAILESEFTRREPWNPLQNR